jgi:hypothetical protein
VRELAGSAVDLNGYAVLFRQWARQADKDGHVLVPAARLAKSADFFDQVVGELLALIPPEQEPDEVQNR